MWPLPKVLEDKNTGQQQDRTEWHKLVFFNRLAEISGNYLKKGSKVYIEGSLRTRSWEKDGITRYSTEIVANEMQMLDGKNDGGNNSSYNQSANDNSYQQPSNANAQQTTPDFDDDIPF